MWKSLAQDRIVLVAGALLGLAWLPLWLPLLTSEQLVGYRLRVLAPALGLATLTVLTGLARLESRIERRFWRLIALALVAYMAVLLLAIPIDSNWDRAPFLSLVCDLLFAVFYLLLVQAIELRPHIEERGDERRRLRPLNVVGSAVLVLGLFAYLPGTAWLFDLERFTTWIPSTLFFALLDLYLVVRLASLWYACELPRWRALYGWLLAAVLYWTAMDASDLLTNLELVTDPLPDRALGAGSWLPVLCVIVAARVRTQPFPAGGAPGTGEDFFQELWGGPLLANALLFPLLHVVTLLAHKSPGTEDARGAVALVGLLLLAGLALSYQRLLRREHRRLEAAHRAVLEQAQLAQHMEAIGRLTGGVAHDFNNLLQVIRLCSENLSEGLELRSPLRPLAEEISLATERATRLTARLLASTRERTFHPVPLDLNQAVLRATSMLQRLIGEDIEVRTELDPDVGGVHVDPEQLEGVLLNLAVNARDAMPRGGTIRVTTGVARCGSAHAQRRRAVLAMQDTGVGMEPSVLERIFEPFFTTKKDGRGTGLGLTMIQAFVAASDGEIEVESTPGHGTTFRLLLPTVELEPQSASPREGTPAAQLEGTATVLVVEDERAVRSVICGLLQSAGFRVLEAGNGLEALDLLERIPREPDLVLSDLIMPHLGGSDLAEQLKERRPHLPVVFMTGYAGEQLPRRGLESIPVLQKPFTRDELARVLSTALARGPGALLVPQAGSASGAPGSPAAPRAVDVRSRV